MTTLALIGVGQWGKNFVDTIGSIPDCELKYICAKSANTLNSFPNKYIKTKDYKELFKYKDIDGVIIATPGSTHFEIASGFLKRGFNLLIEKPLTINYEDALKLQKIAKISRCVMMVGHIYLYNPAFIKIKQLINKIGQIQYINFEGLSNGPVRNDMSVLWDWGPHGISMVLDILQQDPLEISAWAINKLRPETKLYDMVFINLQFSREVSVFIKYSWISHIKKRELVVVASKHTLVFDDLSDQKITYFENFSPHKSGNKFINSELKINYPSYGNQTPLGLEILEFIKSIKNKKNPKTDLDKAVKIVKILDLAERSIMNKGCPIKFK